MTQILVFESDVMRAEVLPELGGRLHRLQAFGVDLLRTPDDVERHRLEPFFWGSYPLVPWCNRLPGGRLEFDGRTVQLPVNFPDGSAIHGFAYEAPWRVVTDSYLEFTHRGSEGYPWPFVAGQHVEVEGNRFGLTLALTNVGDTDLPGGIGIHPWFTTATIELHADRLVSLGPDRIPDGAPPRPVEGRFDLRREVPVPWGVDDIWTDLRARHAHFSWPEHGLRARFSWSLDGGADHVVVAAFEDFGAVAVEPQTMITNHPGRIGRTSAVAVSYFLEVERA